MEEEVGYKKQLYSCVFNADTTSVNHKKPDPNHSRTTLHTPLLFEQHTSNTLLRSDRFDSTFPKENTLVGLHLIRYL